MPGIALDTEKEIETRLMAEGRGYSQKYITSGNGVDFKIAENQDRIFPALTLVNQGIYTVLWGYGTARLQLPAGTAVTLRFKNPKQDSLVVNDQSNSGVEIDVFS